MCELHSNHKSKTQNIYTKPERNPFLHKHTTKENHQTTKIKTKRRNEQTTKTKFKMAIVHTYQELL